MENWSADECYGTGLYANDTYLVCQRTNGALTSIGIEDKIPMSEKGLNGKIQTPIIVKDNNLYFATSESIYGAAVGVDGTIAVNPVVNAPSLCAPVATESALYYVRSDGVYRFANNQSERIYDASVSGTTSVQLDGDTILFLNGGTISLLTPKQEPDNPTPPEQPEISNITVQRDKKDQTKATVTFTVNTDGILYYAVGDADAAQPDVFAGKLSKAVQKGKNTLQLTQLS